MGVVVVVVVVEKVVVVSSFSACGAKASPIVCPQRLDWKKLVVVVYVELEKSALSSKALYPSVLTALPVWSVSNIGL